VKPTLLDTGVIVGLLDRSEAQHNLPGAITAVLENIEQGIFRISFQLSLGSPVRKLMRKYQDSPMHSSSGLARDPRSETIRKPWRQ
jgi:hypothetical protein